MAFILRSVHTNTDLWRAFQARCKAEGRSQVWVLLELVKRYVESGLN